MSEEIIPLPSELTQQIAEYAVELASEAMERRGWNSKGALEPTWGEGEIGIRPAKGREYLDYQNSGTRPFLMTALEGKTIPMPNGRGGTNMITVRGVGQPGWVWIPFKGRFWREQKWLHPGIKPTHFIDDAIDQAIMDFKPEIEEFQFYAQLIRATGELDA